MGLRNRYYLFQDDGVLKRIPHRICDRLPFGEDAIPEYAGTRQRVVQVLVESENRRPVRILDAMGCFWDFDEEGKIHDGLRKSGGEWMVYAFSPAARHKRKEGKVVDLVPEIKKKDLHDRHRWTLTTEDLDRIAADIWPGVHGPAPEVTSVQGKAPKRPPLSTEAKWALEEIGSKLEMIRHKLATLSEHSLKGLEFEALRTATFEDPDLWNGVAAQAKHQREIRAAYRTGKGEWIAVVEAFKTIAPFAEETAATVHVRCASQKEAIEVAKRQMAEKANWLGPDVRLETSICSALEWRDDGEE